MLSRTKELILKAYKKSICVLKSRGIIPRLQELEIEAVKCSKHTCTKKDEKSHLTIQTSPILDMRAVNSDSPLYLWDKLIPRAIIILNLLHPLCINPKYLAYVQVHGAFNYNSTPIAPPGIRAHDHPDDRKSWNVHITYSLYIGATIELYMCHYIWVPTTLATRMIQTAKWMLHNSTMSTASQQQLILVAVHDLKITITNTNQHVTCTNWHRQATQTYNFSPMYVFHR